MLARINDLTEPNPDAITSLFWEPLRANKLLARPHGVCKHAPYERGKHAGAALSRHAVCRPSSERL